MSAIIRACALLARSFESGMPYAPNHALLGISPEEARDAAVKARTEYDKLRADRATVTAERDRAKRWAETCEAGSLKHNEYYESERAAHAETRKALEWRLAACQAFSDTLESTRAELATVTAERDRLEHDTDALSKYCLGRAVMFVQNTNVCQVYSELQAKSWAIVSLTGRERIESERHQYVVKLDALREELAETRKALEQERFKAFSVP